MSIERTGSLEALRVGLVGYGEVGGIFGRGLRQKPELASLSAWDILFDDCNQGAARRRQTREDGVAPAASLAELCAESTLVISAVTAANALAVASEAAASIRSGTFFLDLNSASPDTKRKAAEAVNARGAFYVDAGVMTSVPPYGLAVPMLLSGPRASEILDTLRNAGMNCKLVSEDAGVASAIKMCRSIMIKGLEALVIESYSTARFYGVEHHVLPTLSETFPQIDWEKQGSYFFQRVVQHGKRRAEEMRESAHTVRQAGFPPMMASAIADKQAWVAGLARDGLFEGMCKDAAWQEYADRLIEGMRDVSPADAGAFAIANTSA